MNRKNVMSSRVVVFFCAIGWVCAASANGAPDGSNGNALPAGQKLTVSEDNRVELHVADQDISMILKLLSMQAHRNIIAGRDVVGSVSANLYDVDFYEALDAILHVNGFGYQERGNFIYVYTAEDLAKLEEVGEKLITRIKRLNYITATYAKVLADPLLSDRGTIIINKGVPSSMEPSTEDGGANTFAYSDIVVIRDREEHVEAIVKIIDDLDVRPLQVQIEAVILQMDLTEANAFGTDLSVVLDNNMGIFADPLNVVDQTISGVAGIYPSTGSGQTGQTTVGSVESGAAGIKFGVVTKHVSAFIRALDRVSDTTVIARPKLLVLNRQRAKLLAGRKLGYLSSTSTDVSTTETVEFLEVGTQLTVRPFAGNDGYIRLEVAPKISDGTTIAVGGTIIPNESSNEIQTNVMVRSGHTVVIGGLFKTDTTISRDQVPGLGSLPIVSAAFSGQDDDVQRSEVIFLITPSIVKENALDAGAKSVGADIALIGIGARSGLLPWSRTKQVAAHMRHALKYQRHGDARKALFYTKIALWLEPTNPDALRLKRQLVKPGIVAPGGSVLKRMVDVMIAEQQEAGAQDQDAASDTSEEQAKAAEQAELAAQAKAAERAKAAAQATLAAQAKAAEQARIAAAQAEADEQAKLAAERAKAAEQARRVAQAEAAKQAKIAAAQAKAAKERKAAELSNATESDRGEAPRVITKWPNPSRAPRPKVTAAPKPESKAPATTESTATTAEAK
jgi:type IV pilus assembly protein PilQ